MKASLIEPLFDGPLDIVGDVHGEIDPLLALMHHLGYDEGGNHPDGRRLVFIGDLTDRGPDKRHGEFAEGIKNQTFVRPTDHTRTNPLPPTLRFCSAGCYVF